MRKQNFQQSIKWKPLYDKITHIHHIVNVFDEKQGKKRKKIRFMLFLPSTLKKKEKKSKHKGARRSLTPGPAVFGRSNVNVSYVHTVPSFQILAFRSMYLCIYAPDTYVGNCTVCM